MKPIHLIPMGVSDGVRTFPGLDDLEPLAAALARTFRAPCRIRPEMLDVTFSFDARRAQFYSTAIIQRLERMAESGARVLGVTGCDLFVPILTFVFGEAQVDGSCAVVSTARLDDGFYGLPARGDVLRERLVKEASHELGHTFGLRHCDNWQCVMASSHAVERLDVKGAEFCSVCGRAVRQNGFRVF